MFFHDIRNVIILLSYADLKTELLYMFFEFLGVRTPMRRFPYGCDHEREKLERTQRFSEFVRLQRELLRLNKLASIGSDADPLSIDNSFKIDQNTLNNINQVRHLRATFDFDQFLFPVDLLPSRVELIRFDLDHT